MTDYPTDAQGRFLTVYGFTVYPDGSLHETAMPFGLDRASEWLHGNVDIVHNPHARWLVGAVHEWSHPDALLRGDRPGWSPDGRTLPTSPTGPAS